jgi:hypothetical protein
VLWVVAGLVLGLVIYVLAWLRWGTRGERAAPDGSLAVAGPAAASAPVAASAAAEPTAGRSVAEADGGAAD